MRLLATAIVVALSLAVGASTAAGPPKLRLAYASESPGRRGLDVYVTVVPGGRPRLLAGVAGRDDFSPAWSPDGKLIAYRLNPARGDEGDIMVVPCERREAAQSHQEPGSCRLVAGVVSGRPLDRVLLDRAGGRDIWTMRPDGTSKRRLTKTARSTSTPPGAQTAHESLTRAHARASSRSS